MKKKLLVTTAIEDTWGTNEEILFLGKWCLPISFNKTLMQRRTSVSDYHWRDREKLKVDHTYLEKLNEITLDLLSNFLNEFHEIHRDVEYWRIIVGPWLLNYIPVIWDRWESLSCIKFQPDNDHIETFCINPYSSRNIPTDFTNALHFFDSDQWNHQIYSSIMMTRNDLNIKTNLINSTFNVEERTEPIYRLNLLQYSYKFFLESIEKFFNLIFYKKRKFVLFHSYFPRGFLFKLCLRLKILPGANSFLSKEIMYPQAVNRDDLSKFNINSKGDWNIKSFENFLSNNILKDIPVAYLEGYRALFEIQSELFDAENIFTANAHFASELFKVWSAEQKLKGSKLIISSHGGALYPLYTVFNHQEKIADYRIIWGQSWMSNQIRMPANKINTKVKKYNKLGNISLIDYDSQKYSYRCASIPMGPLVLDGFNQKREFIQKLSQSNKNIFKVRPAPFGGWDTKDRYIDAFGKDIISKDSSLRDTILNSRLLICAYPQTSFSEAMFSGIPTMLLYEDKFWEVQPIYDELINLLKETHIVHTSATSAARHLERIVEDPMRWWNESETAIAREKFNDLCLTIDPEPFNLWVKFFNKLS